MGDRAGGMAELSTRTQQLPPRPRFLRRVWLPGVQYEGETLEQMEARERQSRENDARADAEEKRLWEWKRRPWWVD